MHFDQKFPHPLLRSAIIAPAAFLVFAVLTTPSLRSESWEIPKTSYHPEDRQEQGRMEYEDMGIFEAWKKYGEKLSWGKGQTLAQLDDSFELETPEWKVSMPWGPKIIDHWNTVENNADPSPIPPAYHGTTLGFPSSLNFEGRGGIAFNNQLAPLRCVRRVHFKTTMENGEVQSAEMESIKKGLEWVLANRERLNITTVKLAIVDDDVPPKHAEPPTSEIDGLLRQLRDLGVWVSAPNGNRNSATHTSWPAIAPDCFGIGASIRFRDAQRIHRDRNEHTDLIVRAAFTSGANAYAAASSMVLREAIEKTGFDWKPYGKNLPEAMMAIFQKTGTPLEDRKGGRTFASLNLLAALDYVMDPQPAPASPTETSE